MCRQNHGAGAERQFGLARFINVAKHVAPPAERRTLPFRIGPNSQQAARYVVPPSAHPRHNSCPAVSAGRHVSRTNCLRPLHLPQRPDPWRRLRHRPRLPPGRTRALLRAHRRRRRLPLGRRIRTLDSHHRLARDGRLAPHRHRRPRARSRRPGPRLPRRRHLQPARDARRRPAPLRRPRRHLAAHRTALQARRQRGRPRQRRASRRRPARRPYPFPRLARRRPVAQHRPRRHLGARRLVSRRRHHARRRLRRSPAPADGRHRLDPLRLARRHGRPTHPDALRRRFHPRDRALPLDRRRRHLVARPRPATATTPARTP